MPTTPYAKILVSIDGAASTSGGVTCDPEAEIQVSYESTIGWPATPVPYLEIYAYPDGYDPGAGWTLESVVQPAAVGGTGDAWRYYGATPPPAFDAPTAAEWGKLGLMLVVAGGRKNGAISGDMIDTATVISVLGPNGEHDIMHREAKQFGGWKKWVAELQFNFHLLGGLIGAIAPKTARYWLDTATSSAALPNAITTRALAADLEITGGPLTSFKVRRVAEPINDTVDVFTVTADATTAGVAGYGPGVLLRAKGAAALQDAGRIGAELTNVTAASEASEVFVETRTAGGSLARSISFTPTGARLAYGGGVMGRNEANAATIALVHLGTSDFSGNDTITVGDPAADALELLAGSGKVIRASVDGVEVLTIEETLISFLKPTRHVASTVAGLSAYPAASYQDCSIIVTNEAGGRTLATSDGTDWRRVSDGAICS